LKLAVLGELMVLGKVGAAPTASSSVGRSQPASSSRPRKWCMGSRYWVAELPEYGVLP